MKIGDKMHVISRKRLLDFANRHPDSRKSLDGWYRIIKKTIFSSFADLRRVFSSADQVGDFTVFNIGGNKIRLITLIFYKSAKVYIRHILTHSEYDKGKWKE